MTSRFSWGVLFAASLAVFVSALSVNAAILYQQNFDPLVPTSSASANFGGFGQINNIGGTGWQVQGGGGGNGISVTAGIDTSGVAGSQSLFATWDHSAASSFTFNQYTVYGLPALNLPLSQIQVSLDLFMSGSETANDPIAISLQQGGGATFGERKFTPTLANNAFTNVQFTLDQATAGGLDFDPSQAFNFQVNHGAGGFGFDANNTVRIDNVLIQSVPEPASGRIDGAGNCRIFVVPQMHKVLKNYRAGGGASESDFKAEESFMWHQMVRRVACFAALWQFMSCAVGQAAQGNFPLFTTQEDFTPVFSATTDPPASLIEFTGLGAVATPDFDGAAINGLGNTSGQAGAAGTPARSRLPGTPARTISFTAVASKEMRHS